MSKKLVNYLAEFTESVRKEYDFTLKLLGEHLQYEGDVIYKFEKVWADTMIYSEKPFSSMMWSMVGATVLIGWTMKNYPKRRPLDHLDIFLAQMRDRLEVDEQRWGDTWLHRPTKGQELRTSERFRDYFDQWKYVSRDFPWLKVYGNALICWVRLAHPELFSEPNKTA